MLPPAPVERGGELAGPLRGVACTLPPLAGQRIDFLYKAMRILRDSKRHSADPISSVQTSNLPDNDIRALAHYAASR